MDQEELDKLNKEYNEAVQNKQSKTTSQYNPYQQVCPSCGHCPVCGQRRYPQYPYNQPFYTTCGTGTQQ